MYPVKCATYFHRHLERSERPMHSRRQLHGSFASLRMTGWIYAANFGTPKTLALPPEVARRIRFQPQVFLSTCRVFEGLCDLRSKPTELHDLCRVQAFPL